MCAHACVLLRGAASAAQTCSSNHATETSSLAILPCPKRLSCRLLLHHTCLVHHKPAAGTACVWCTWHAYTAQLTAGNSGLHWHTACTSGFCTSVHLCHACLLFHCSCHPASCPARSKAMPRAKRCMLPLACSAPSHTASIKNYFCKLRQPASTHSGTSFCVLLHPAALLLQGQLLGVGGKQLQRIKQESAARVEVNNAEGNLNGSHPDPLDPNLHALISADSVVS